MAKPKRQPSSIDRQSEEVRETIGKLRVQGRTIDEILAHLRLMDVDVSRSALGRHVQRMADVAERMKLSRDMAVALTARFGDEPDNRLARLNLELMHSVVMQVITATTVDEDGETQPVVLDAEQAMFLARSLKDLSSAQKTDSDRMILVKREVAKEAAQAVDKVAARVAGGLTRETVDAIKAEILGLAK